MSDDQERKKLDSAAQVLQGLFQNSKSPLSEGFQRYRLEQQWDMIFKGSLGALTRPLDYQDGLLTIAVKNPSLLTELQFFKQDIMTKVNTHVGRVWVKNVRFVSE
jgi:hypothetical protein